MRCKSCDALMTRFEAKDILYANEDGSVIVYNDWCFDCAALYGSEEALDLLDSKWYQCEADTEVEECDVVHNNETSEPQNVTHFKV
jgi:hypothetical protein